MQNFRWLSGDVNWMTYGGNWYRRLFPRRLPFERYHVIVFDSWEEMVGAREVERQELPRYNVLVKDYDLSRVRPQDILGSLDSCGHLDAGHQLRPDGFGRGRPVPEVLYLPKLSGRHPAETFAGPLKSDEDRIDQAALFYLLEHFPLVVLETLNCCGYDERLADLSRDNARELLAEARLVSHAED